MREETHEVVLRTEQLRSRKTFRRHFADGAAVPAGRASGVAGAMERPGMLGVIAALVVGFSVLFMLASVPKAWHLFQEHQDTVVGSIEELVYGGIVLVVFLLGCLGVATGIGLYFLSRWARVSILTLSALFPYVFVMMVVAFLYEPTSFGLGDELPYAFGAAILVLAMGIWWLFYFNRPSVRRLFQASRKTSRNG